MDRHPHIRRWSNPLLHQLSCVAPAVVCDLQSTVAVSNDRRRHFAVLARRAPGHSQG